MTSLSAITLLINGLTLALAFSFLIIFLWSDPRKELYQFLAVFVVLVGLWQAGALITQSAILLGEPRGSPLLVASISILELGFTGSSVAVYALTAVIVRLGTRAFRVLAFTSLLIVVAYRVLLIVSGAPVEISDTALPFVYRAPPVLIVFYLIFGGVTLYMVWRYRGKIRSRGVGIGLAVFVAGQFLGFINPDREAFGFSMTLSALATLMICFAILKWEIIDPLTERNAQVDALRRVSLSITSSIERKTVLDQIATQTAALLGADGVAVFLADEKRSLRVATTYHLPMQYAQYHPSMGGISGQVIRDGQPVLIEDYGRQWRGEDDLPLARETFGSLIATPLIFSDEIIGVLMVIAGRHGRIFNREDQYLLQLLAGQASLAIGHSRLLMAQDALTQQVELGRAQLETVLTSTESPVIALDRRLRLIFANPAARSVFAGLADAQAGDDLVSRLPAKAFPPHPVAAFRRIRDEKAYSYEFPVDERSFLCHAAALGRQRVEGFVVVLNDVTQLKELDRMKSEMVRMTSHDLKNPLQGAMANLELLRADVYGGADDEVRLSIDEVDKQLQRMYRIIRGILDLERVRDGRLTLEWCDPRQIVERVNDEQRDYARDRHIVLIDAIPEGLHPVPCDKEQFTRAIINLVENAIKFTQARGTVTVDAREVGDETWFIVQDTGIGIRPELHERVFDRFFRGNQKGAEHVSGTGLGLSLVKTIVDHHHGRVWLESAEGQGTTFYIALPRQISRVRTGLQNPVSFA